MHAHKLWVRPNFFSIVSRVRQCSDSILSLSVGADALFAESDGHFDLLASQLSWYNIAESDAESTSDEYLDTSTSEGGGDSELGYDRLSDMSDIVEYMNGFVHDE